MEDEASAAARIRLRQLGLLRDHRDQYFQGLVELCSETVGSERCTVYVVETKEHRIKSWAAQRVGTSISLEIGEGLAGQVAATGETINVMDAYADPRFDPTVDQRLGYRTASMLVVPVWSGDGRRVVGVIQALNKKVGVFERQDQVLLEQIAAGAAPVIEQARVGLE
jgi:serine/threonine-protein kinase